MKEHMGKIIIQDDSAVVDKQSFSRDDIHEVKENSNGTTTVVFSKRLRDFWNKKFF